MSAHTCSTIVPAPASGPGALEHYSSTCTCGMVLASTMLTLVQADVVAHLRYHERQRSSSRPAR
jgi:hypothetical protein